MSVTVFTHEELEKLEAQSFAPRFLCLPMGVIGLVALTFQWPSDHLAVTIGWTLVTAYSFFCWTSCFHETAHQTLSTARWPSIWLGRILGTAMFMPYSVYRESHIRHHAYLNKPADWELWPYSDPTTSLTFRRIFVWFDLMFGVFTSPAIYSRIYWHKNSPIKSQEVRWTIFYEYLAILAVWTTVLSSVIYFGVVQDFLRVWVVPHFLAGVWQSFRKFTEHLGMVSYDPMLGTRTVIGSNWFTKLASYANFDIFIHGPHHRHPRVAHNELTGKMYDYMKNNPRPDYPLFTSYTQALLDTVPYLFNPGVGMNMGAPAPSRSKDDDVRNFVADVTSEVLADADAVIKEPAA